MPKPVILLSIPALREKDVTAMPKLRSLMAGGEIAELTPGFPCVTCPVQAAMTTGRRPAEHGIVANGLYWREKQQVEMWTAPNDCIERPQLWDLLSHHGKTGTGTSQETAFTGHGRVGSEPVPVLPGSPRPSGSRCTARAARRITSARPPRFTIPTAPSRSGATRGRWNSTANCATPWATFR